HVGHHELELDGRRLALQTTQALQDALPRLVCGDALAVGVRAGDESLEISQLLQELGFVHEAARTQAIERRQWSGGSPLRSAPAPCFNRAREPGPSSWLDRRRDAGFQAH